MPIRLRLPPRKIETTPPSASFQKSTVTLTVEKSHARQISELPKDQLDVVIEAMRDGLGPTAIAHHFGEQGWLRVTEKTFIQYLMAFKRVNPEMIAEPEESSTLDVTDLPRGANLNGVVSKRKPAMDEEKELEQLVRVQSVRLRRGVEFELRTGLTNQHLHKDIRASKELLETLGRMRGKLSSAGRPAANGHMPVSNEAQEQLRKADVSEAAQDRLVTLMATLAPMVKAKVEKDEAVKA